MSPAQESGVIRMKSFANRHPARSYPRIRYQRPDVLGNQGKPPLWLAHETRALVQGKIHYGPVDSKPDMITSGAMMTKTDGLDAREGMLGVPAQLFSGPSDMDLGASMGTCEIDVSRHRASGFDPPPAATPSLPCEEIPW